MRNFSPEYGSSAEDILGLGSLFSPSSSRQTHFFAWSQKLWQADDIVGCNGEDKDGADLGEAAHLHLCEPADSLAPAEAFLDAFAQPLADRITKARCDLRRDGGLARLAGSCSPSR